MFLGGQAIYKSRQDADASSRAKEHAREIMSQLDLDGNKKLTEAEFIQGTKLCPSILKILQPQETTGR